MVYLCKALDTIGKCFAHLPQTKNEVTEQQQQQQKFIKTNFGPTGDVHKNFKLCLLSGSFVDE